MYTNRGKDEQIAVRVHNGILLSTVKGANYWCT
jgi:hypothetical protein